jgi:hypothetical protein
MTPKVLLPLLLTTAVLAIPVGYAAVSFLSNSGVSAPNGLASQGVQGVNGTASGTSASGQGGGGVHAVPGPVAGAGLPIVLVAGAGAYWLLRRRRNTA